MDYVNVCLIFQETSVEVLSISKNAWSLHTLPYVLKLQPRTNLTTYYHQETVHGVVTVNSDGNDYEARQTSLLHCYSFRMPIKEIHSIFSTRVLTGDTNFTSPTGDGTAILGDHPSHAKVSPLAVQRECLHFSVILRP